MKKLPTMVSAYMRAFNHYGNFTDAARVFGVTTPAIHQAFKKYRIAVKKTKVVVIHKKAVRR